MSHIIRAACPHDCPDTCALLITVDDAGRAVQVRGDPDHPTTAGTLCTKVAHYTERVYSPDRLLHPMKRVGRKGEGRYERISWDEALANQSAIAPLGEAKPNSEIFRLLAQRMGYDPLPCYVPPHESPRSNPAMAKTPTP